MCTNFCIQYSNYNVYVCVCVCACVRACVRVCVCVCVCERERERERERTTPLTYSIFCSVCVTMKLILNCVNSIIEFVLCIHHIHWSIFVCYIVSL